MGPTMWWIVFAGISTPVVVAIIGLCGVLGAATITALVTFATIRSKEERSYRDQRIKTLEDREASVLTKVVSTLENQQESLGSIGIFVTALMDDRKYEERRRREGRER